MQDEGAAAGSVIGCPPHEQAAALESVGASLDPDDADLLGWILDRIQAERRLQGRPGGWCPLTDADLEILAEATGSSTDQVQTRITHLLAAGYLQADICHRTGELRAVFPCLRVPPWYWPLWPRRNCPDA